MSENADTEELKSKTTESPKSLIPSCEIEDSFNDTDEHSKSLKQAPAADDEEDRSQISESTFTESLMSPSQLGLKDNYIKAKRERQIEQEQAELEKVRLQEILDICMEFQRQEDIKSSLKQNECQEANQTVLRDSSSTSSSVSSTSSVLLTPTTPVGKSLTSESKSEKPIESHEEMSHCSSGCSINLGSEKNSAKRLDSQKIQRNSNNTEKVKELSISEPLRCQKGSNGVFTKNPTKVSTYEFNLKETVVVIEYFTHHLLIIM